MTSKTVYVCEVCGAEYDCPDGAKACEKTHKSIKSVETIVYNKTGEYPLVVAITFDDGERLRYNVDL